MQWIDLFVVLVLGGAVLKTFMYYKDPKRSGGCHGSCSSCSQQCSYRENKTEINIRQKKY